MNYASFRFYSSLNDFLPLNRKQSEFFYSFVDRSTIKDMIEAIGIPHTEIDLIICNSEPVDFLYMVENGDRFSVYPRFFSIDITGLLNVRPEPLEQIRFVLDVHLGRLAGYLRMLGFDSLYRNDYEDEKLAEISKLEKRVLLTRDIGLLKRGIVDHGYWVRATNPEEQLIELSQRFDLLKLQLPFQRCMKCNGMLNEVSKESIIDRLLPKTKEVFDQFYICSSCDQIYWKGSHYEKMQKLLNNTEEALNQSR
jgi:uncharacterized protein